MFIIIDFFFSLLLYGSDVKNQETSLVERDIVRSGKKAMQSGHFPSHPKAYPF